LDILVFYNRSTKRFASGSIFFSFAFGSEANPATLLASSLAKQLVSWLVPSKFYYFVTACFASEAKQVKTKRAGVVAANCPLAIASLGGSFASEANHQCSFAAGAILLAKQSVGDLFASLFCLLCKNKSKKAKQAIINYL
jgi:hypothetical protein